jgi:hypothetical protein
MLTPRVTDATSWMAAATFEAAEFLHLAEPSEVAWT